MESKGSFQSANSVLEKVDQVIRQSFERNRRVLSYAEYLALLAENPDQQLRSSAQYTVEMMDHFGKTPISQPTAAEEGGATYRFHLFDDPVDGIAPKVVGQEAAQTEIYQTLRSFAR